MASNNLVVTFNKLTSDDINRYTQPLRTGYVADDFDTFKTDSSWSGKEYLKRSESSHKRFAIKLAREVMNTVICRKSMEFPAKVLGRSVKMIKALALMNAYLYYDDDKINDYVITVSKQDVPAGHESLTGPEAMRELFDDLDIEEELLKIVQDALKHKDLFKVTVGSGKANITQDFYLSPVNPNADIPIEVYENEVYEMRKELFDKNNQRFTLLYSNRHVKNPWDVFFLDAIVVIPADMRKTIGNMPHKLDTHYVAIKRASERLEMAMQDTANEKQYISSYKNLQYEVDKYLCSSDGSDDQDKDIVTRISGKHGQIRNRNLGRRQDYSGRAVVCINPALPIDTIRVPKKMLTKLYGFHILSELHDSYINGTEPKLLQRDFSNLDEPAIQRELLKYLLDHEIYKQVPIYMGRQPTLHKQSLQGFHIEVTDYNAIEVNPLVCPAYNMDFDGDQAHLEVPLGKRAVKEVRDLLLTTNNLFLAKTGDITTVPRQDMLLGLYRCTNGTTPNNEQNPYRDLFSLYSGLMHNSISVDAPFNLNGTTMRAGDAAVYSCFSPNIIDPVKLTGGNPKDLLKSYIKKTGKLAIVTINNKSIKVYADYIANAFVEGKITSIGHGKSDNTTVIGILNKLVELGFTVAKYYTPPMTLLGTGLNNVDPKQLYKSILEIYDTTNGEAVHCLTSAFTMSEGQAQQVVNTLNEFKVKCVTNIAGNNIDITSDIMNGVSPAEISIKHNIPEKLGDIDSLSKMYDFVMNQDVQLRDPNINLKKFALKMFNDGMADTSYYYKLGLENRSSFSKVFNEERDKMSNMIDDNIVKTLGQNGYSELAVSGARGTTSNLTQLFAYLGQIKKNDTETFDALITRSLSEQLSPMQHFISAYGGRSGQMDKTLKTGDTGYASRKMWHYTQGIAITNEDCGTKEGMLYTKRDILQVLDTGAENLTGQVEDIMEHILTGRYAIGYSDGDGNVTTFAPKLMIGGAIKEMLKHEGVLIRSPHKCKRPCCAKCYGYDWSTRQDVLVGTNVGINAAHSIGEPGTQLTLKTFQKGGQADKNAITSAFDRFNYYLNVSDIKGKPGYDPLSPADGYVQEVISSDPRDKKLVVRNKLDTSKDSQGAIVASFTVPANLSVRSEVFKGQGISETRGDYSIQEYYKYNGFEATLRFIALKMYSIYRGSEDIAFIHFEVLVNAMTRYIVVSSKRDDLKVGQAYSREDIFTKPYSFTYDDTFMYSDELILRPRIMSLRSCLDATGSALDRIQMEDFGEGLALNVLLHTTDNLTKPINRMVVSKAPLIPGYADPETEAYIQKRSLRR